MKEAVTKVIDTLIQEDFHGAFQKLLEQYNKCMQPEEITSKWARVSCVYYTINISSSLKISNKNILKNILEI